MLYCPPVYCGHFANLTVDNKVVGPFKVENVVAAKVNSVIVVDGEKYERSSSGINAAIGDLPSDGGVVYLPGGHWYTITSPIVLNANSWTRRIKLTGDGSGSYLRKSDGYDGNVIEVTGSINFQYEISNLSIYGNKSNCSGGHGIYLTATTGGGDTWGKIKDVHIEAMNGNGILMNQASHRSLILADIRVYNVNGHGVELTSSDHRIENVQVYSSGQHGFYMKDWNSTYDNIYTSWCGKLSTEDVQYYGVWIEGKENQISNSQFQDSYAGAVYINNSDTRIVASNFENSNINPAGAGGADMLSGNWSYLTMSAAADHCTIIGNTFGDWKGKTPRMAYGITVEEGVENSMVVNNKLLGVSDTSIVAGVQAEANNMVSGNYLKQ